VMDYKYNSREEWETLDHDPHDDYHEPRLNVYGESTDRVIANLDFLLDKTATTPSTLRASNRSICSGTSFNTAWTSHTLNTYQTAWGPIHHGIHNHITNARDPDWEHLRPFFGY
jgi:hypothetical protein